MQVYLREGGLMRAEDDHLKADEVDQSDRDDVDTLDKTGGDGADKVHKSVPVEDTWTLRKNDPWAPHKTVNVLHDPRYIPGFL
jgi:hypothetical protein